MACCATAGELVRALAPAAATVVPSSVVAAEPSPAAPPAEAPPPGLRNASTLLGLDSCGTGWEVTGLACADCGPAQGAAGGRVGRGTSPAVHPVLYACHLGHGTD